MLKKVDGEDTPLAKSGGVSKWENELKKRED